MLKSKKTRNPGYELNDFQRNLFLKKILPTLFLGSFIWFVGELTFSFAFQEVQLAGSFLIIYIISLIGEVGLFLCIFFLSKHDKKVICLFLYLIFSYLAGIVSLPIAIYTDYLTQVHMLVGLTIGANFVIFLMGLLLKQKYFMKGHFWEHIFLFLIGTALVEVIFVIIFDIHNFLLTIPLTLSYICAIALTTMFYGAKVIRKNEQKSWIFMFSKIQGMMLLSLIIAIALVLLVLLIVVIAILAGDSNIDLSGISISGSSRKRKKEVQMN